VCTGVLVLLVVLVVLELVPGYQPISASAQLKYPSDGWYLVVVVVAVVVPVLVEVLLLVLVVNVLCSPGDELLQVAARMECDRPCSFCVAGASVAGGELL
jgi:hypothetical protein